MRTAVLIAAALLLTACKSTREAISERLRLEVALFHHQREADQFEELYAKEIAEFEANQNKETP